MSGWGYVALGWSGCALVLAGYVGWLLRRSRRLEALAARVEEPTP